jgi:uncharacterized OB-fold protein
MSKRSRGSAGSHHLGSMPHRHLPAITVENAFFWRAGESGILRFMRCRSCGFYIHPPLPICRVCKSRDVQDEPVSGRGTVLTYTVNRQVWEAGLEAPYVIAIVELAEQRGLRLTTNIVNCQLDEVRIGMPARVVFEQHADVWLPLFEPDTAPMMGG